MPKYSRISANRFRCPLGQSEANWRKRAAASLPAGKAGKAPAKIRKGGEAARLTISSFSLAAKIYALLFTTRHPAIIS